MGGLKAGTSKREITPPVGTTLSGYIRRFGNSTGVHDPLWANFLWIEDGNNQALLISLDVMNIGTEFATKGRQTICRELDLKKESVLVAAIHTHSAPGIHPFRDDSLRDTDWEGRVLEALVSGSHQAREGAKKAILGLDKRQAPVGHNRRKPGRKIDSTLSLAFFRYFLTSSGLA